MGVAAFENLVLSGDRVDTDEEDMPSAVLLESEGASTSGRETQPAPEVKERVRFCAWKFFLLCKPCELTRTITITKIKGN